MNKTGVIKYGGREGVFITKDKMYRMKLKHGISNYNYDYRDYVNKKVKLSCWLNEVGQLCIWTIEVVK